MALPSAAGAKSSQDRGQFFEFLHSKSGALASSLIQKIKRSKGDVRHIMEIVGEAEMADLEPQLLDRVLNEAMNSFGPVAVMLRFEDYSELCLRRFQLLCGLDAREADLFFKFMRQKGICQKDARTYIARAELALKASRTGEAERVLEDGLAAGAEPAEDIRARLQRLREAASTPEGGHSAAVAAPQGTAGFAAASGSGSTPVRPRALRYSGGAVEPGPIVGSDGAVGAGLALIAPTAELPSDAKGREPLAPIVEWAHRSSLDNLSPIIEADSVDHSNLNESALVLGDGAAFGALGAHRRLSGGMPLAAARLSPVATERAAPHELRGVGTPEAAERVEVHCNAERRAAATEGSPLDASGEADLSDLSIHSLDASLGEIQPQPPKPIVVNGISYRRQKTLGKGGSSRVYLVQDPSGRPFALKRVSTNCRSHFEALANEVTLLQQLKECPHVIQVFDAQVSPEKGLIYIVMERGDIDLKHFLESEHDLSLGDIQILWRQILEAVRVIHHERIVHSDLKPANFLLVNGRLKLIDFGIAKRMPSETTHISRDASVGTISYMAPEAVKQGQLKLGRSSDIWSLGIMLYQMVYQRAPFAHLEPMARILALTDPNMIMSFPPGHRLDGHSDSAKTMLIDVLEQCLQRDPRRRPSIPQLLQHPFLQDSMSITRSAFDRSMQMVVSGFCEAVRHTLTGGDGVHEDAGIEDIELPCREQWQSLTDQVWSSMSQKEHGIVRRRQAERCDSADTLGMVQFQNVLRHWMSRGTCKRQRTDISSTNVSTDAASSADAFSPDKLLSPLASAAPAAARPKLASRPPPPPPLAKAGAEPAKLAARKPTAVLAAAPQASVFSAGAGGTAGGGSGQAFIDAGLLQQGRAGLKKVVPGSARGDKENSAPNGGGNGVCNEDNPALKRLKERRCVVADERTEELTATTRWLS